MPDIDLTSPWPGEQIARLLRPASSVVPLLGAGVSCTSGLPTGAGLATWVRAHPLAEGVDFLGLAAASLNDPLIVTQQIIDQCPDRRNDLLAAVRDHFTDLSRSAVVSPELQDLVRIPSGLIITLNYDDLVERAARAQDLAVLPLGRDGIADLIANGFPVTDGVLRVVHLHGAVNLQEPIVLANDEYGRVMSDLAVRELFAAVVPEHNLCLLGTSFEEPHLAMPLRVLRVHPPRHVIVCSESVAATVGDGTGVVNEVVHGVVACSHADGDFGAIPGFVARLVEGDTAVRPVPTALDDPLYTPRQLLRVDLKEDPEVALMMGDLELIGERGLIDRPRAIVLGVPGGGKSLLLASLASTPLPGEQAALIRLRSVRDFIGEPRTLLEAWLSASHVDSADVVIDDVFSGEVRLHLMFDGLDEVTPGDRPAAVDAITRIGAALPHARITLTTRPTAAVDGFDGDWERYALRCDGAWQTAFLARAGTSIEELRLRLGPAVTVVEPLLAIPFFVRQLVDLTNAELEAAVAEGDALGVLLTLLDQQIDADPNIRLVRPAVRQWLGRVAMLMQLTGRRAVALDDIRPLAADLDLGDIDALTDRLANRSLLEEAADQWSFGHRIFSEALVAVALASEHPSGWLDVVAPEFDGRSAVREDWLAPLDLVCARNGEWREALRRRDEITVARLTPSSAAPAERAAAAVALWERASDLQVWLDAKFDGGFDDGEIIARLVNAGDVEAVDELFDAGLASESRYDRANALDILVQVRPELASALVRGVLTNEQDSTLRRSAASWARRLDLAELLELVIERACAPADDAEATDMASIAIALTEPVRRPAVGRQILAAGNTEVNYWQVFEDAPLDENLRWLLDAARADLDDAPWGVGRKLVDLLSDLDDPTEDEARLAGELVVVSGVDSPEAVEWVLAHPASFAGVAKAVSDGEERFYAVAGLLERIGSVQLRAHGVPLETVEIVERWEQAREQRAIQPVDVRQEAVVRDEPPPPLTLEDVLELDGTGPYDPLLRQRTRLQREAEQANAHIRQRLGEFLDREWGDRDLRSGITLTEGGATVQHWANLVLSYGPPARLELDDERWEQAATCGWLFTEQYRWLRPQASQPRLDRAAGVAPLSARVLANLLALAEDLDPSCVAARARELDVAELDGRRGPGLLEGLASAGATDALREIRDRGGDFAARVDPLLARAGDVQAQRGALERLKERIARGEHVDRHSEPWIEAIKDVSLLEPIVATVIEAKQRSQEFDPFDISDSLLGAIERIGGAPALAVLDRLIAERPWDGAQWLRRMRDAVLQRELAQVALGPSTAKLASRGLPSIGTAPER